jgi:hypothetical protein
LKKRVVSGKLLKEPKAFHKEEVTMKETTHQTEYSTLSTLYLAFELSQKKWKLGFSVGLGQEAWKRTVEAGDLVALGQAIQLAKKRLGLLEACRVMSCYEAGWDGFWLHRCLVSQGIANVVVDSASIEVNRRAKRAKMDRLIETRWRGSYNMAENKKEGEHSRKGVPPQNPKLAVLCSSCIGELFSHPFIQDMFSRLPNPG